MLITYLGWGSLIWDPRDLPICGIWFKDGPFLPIEFARQSNDERLTLVLVPKKPLVRSLWAEASLTDRDEARERLRSRECIKTKNMKKHIGCWPDDSPKDETRERIEHWAKSLSIECVLWTTLPPKFNGKDGKVPTEEDAVQHLRALSHAKRKNAERYIRMTPRQIDTEYRRRIERELGWTPLSRI